MGKLFSHVCAAESIRHTNNEIIWNTQTSVFEHQVAEQNTNRDCAIHGIRLDEYGVFIHGFKVQVRDRFQNEEVMKQGPKTLQGQPAPETRK